MEIVLTAERCLMSNYNGMLFIGFMGCAPKNLIPSKIFFSLLFPPVKAKDGRAILAPYGTRKIEAALVDSGFDVVVVPPEKIKNFMDKAKIIGVTTNDPLGLGPASSTFAGKHGLVKEEPYNAYCFRNLMSIIRKSKAKIAVGGAGAWQLADEKTMKEFGIDIVVIGEGEKTVPELFGRILNGEDLRGVFYGEVAEKIPIIKGAAIGGIVEIARGCGRGCKFCQPTLQRLRNRSLEEIMKEAEINARVNKFVTLHAEDVFRYKADGFKVNEEEVLKLFSSVAKISRVGISHFSLASLASAEKVVEEISGILGIPSKEQPWLSGQTGIETGSVRIVKEYMAGKVLPFKPEEWCEVVEQAFGICSDNHWVPCATLVIGFPKETEDDVIRTIELLDRLKGYKSLIVPLFFVPLSSLKDQRPFTSEDLKPYHWSLLLKCFEHDIRWLRILAEEYLAKMPMLPRAFMKRFINWAIREGEKRLKEVIKVAR